MGNLWALICCVFGSIHQRRHVQFRLVLLCPVFENGCDPASDFNRATDFEALGDSMSTDRSLDLISKPGVHLGIENPHSLINGIPRCPGGLWVRDDGFGR